jgi:hypothetical protein
MDNENKIEIRVIPYWEGGPKKTCPNLDWIVSALQTQVKVKRKLPARRVARVVPLFSARLTHFGAHAHTPLRPTDHFKAPHTSLENA